MKKNLLNFITCLFLVTLLLSTKHSIANNLIIDSFFSIPAFPLNINYISAKWNDGQNVSVTWEVSKEIGTRQYEIQRSVDGSNFYTIEISTNTTNDGEKAVYKVTDINAVIGRSYYRIKGVSLTGKFFYSDIVTIRVLK